MSVESHRDSIESAGHTRKLMVSVPETLLPGAKLLIALHGSTQRGSIMRKTSEFDQWVERENWVVFYPDAMGGIWKDGRDADAGIDDVRFISDLVDYAVQEFGVDKDRAYLVGVSNGGFMTQRVLCERPELFRAAACVIANLGSDLANRCHAGMVPSLFLLAGTEDPVVPFHGGYVHRPDGSRYLGSILSFDDSVAHWRGQGLWSQEAETSEETLDDGIRVTSTLYRSPQHEEQLKVVLVHGGGHFWFGKQMPEALQETFGPTTVLYSTTQAIWAFFSSLD